MEKWVNKKRQLNGAEEFDRYIESYLQEPRIDFRRYLLVLLHYKWILITVPVICAVLAVLYSLRLDKKYNTSFGIYYDCVVEQYFQQIDAPGFTNFDEEYWEKVMNSERLLNLVHDNSGCQYSSPQLREIFRVSRGKKLDNIYTVQLSVHDTAVILPLARAYVKSLNQLDEMNHKVGFEKTIEYLYSQLGNNKTQLSDLEKEILKLNSRLNIHELKGLEQLKTIYENYKKTLNDSRIELAAMRATKNQIKHEITNQKDTLMKEVSFTEPLKVQLMNLHVDLARSLTKYKDDHPVVKGIRNNIAKVEMMLKNGIEQNVEVKNLSVNPLKERLMSDYIQTGIDEISLSAKVISLEKVIKEFEKQLTPGVKSNGFSDLLRRRELLLGTINMLNSKIIEVEAALHGKNSRFILIDEPLIPTQPNQKAKAFFLILGFILGLFLALAVVVGLDFIDNRIRLVSDFEKFFTLPILGTIRHRKKQHTIRELIDEPMKLKDGIMVHEMAEIRINFNQRRGDGKLVAMVSANQKEGKTFSSFLLAQEMALTGRKVLIVDLDTYSPMLTHNLGIRSHLGLQDYLFGNLELDEVTEKTPFNNLFAIGVGQNHYNANIYYDSKRFNNFMSEVARKYDLVFFDTPALLYIPEVAGFLDQVDGLIFLAKLFETTRSDMDRVIKKTSHMKVDKLGAIILGVKQNVLDPYCKYNYYNYYYSKRHDGILRQEKGAKKKGDPAQEPAATAESGGVGSAKSRKIVTLLVLVTVSASLLGFALRSTFRKNNNEDVIFYEQAGVVGSSSGDIIEAKVEKTVVDMKEESSVDYMYSGTPREVNNSLTQNKAVGANGIRNSIKPKTNQIKSDENVQLKQSEKQYHISAGCFKNLNYAEQLIKDLQSEGYSASLFGGTAQGLHIVVVGAFKSKEEAKERAKEIREESNFQAIVFCK
ncbi:hypothetical protein EYV94_08255 [Puteibacter caeruleilacunae]|nr:hypothetical protein EYV94_08255 [Puteibacter caeruleilacunae]